MSCLSLSHKHTQGEGEREGQRYKEGGGEIQYPYRVTLDLKGST